MRGLVERGKVNIGFIDGQWGSSGKGKFNASLAFTDEIDFAISQNSVNASHIVVWDDGREYKFQHLPTSVVNSRVKAIIGAGASIDLQQLLKEIDDWDMGSSLFIHPNAVVITQEDIDYEKEHLLRIASTMTGNGAAAARKVMRHPGVRTASDVPELRHLIANTYDKMYNWLARGETGILETAQGFDLSMDHGMVFDDFGAIHKAYPYTTSRNVDPLTFAGMSGLSRNMIGKIFLNLRTLPIRVGDGSNNEKDGLHTELDLSKSHSGAHWPDQDELTWGDVTAISGSPTPLLEMTSLTKRVRRIFSFSLMQLQHITRIVQPDFITLNFVNYMDHSISGKSGIMTRDELDATHSGIGAIVRMIEHHQFWASTKDAGKVVALGTGPKDSQMIRLV